MSTQLVLGVVGAGIGALAGSPQIGFMIGSAIGGLIDRPDGPSPGDLSAPQIQQGAALPRVYGCVRMPANPAWASAFRATENPTPGKGGPPGGSAGYSYALDMLCTLADGLNVIGITRVWINKKLVWTALSESDMGSLNASAVTDAWGEVALFTGALSQMPWGVYETAVGTADAVAYRHQATLAITDLQCGGSKTPPLVEVEVITAGTVTPADAVTYEFPGRSFDATYVDDFDTYPGPGTTYERPDGPWSITINGFAFTSSENSVHSDIVRWLCKPNAFAYYIWIYLYGTQGQLRVSFNNAESIVGPAAPQGEIRLTFDDTTNLATLYVNDLEVGSTTVTSAETPGIGYPPQEVRIGPEVQGGAGTATVYGIESVVLTVGTLPIDTYVPLSIDLADIVNAELALNGAVNLADHDTSALVGIPVRGFKAAGSTARVIAELAEAFHFDVVPANPIRYVPRGTAPVGAIAWADTGVGVDQPGQPFSGLKRGNDGEIPAVFGLQYPNVLQDHEPGFERSDRLITDGPDINKVSTNVVFEPAEARGWAVTRALLARAASHTAAIGLSDKFARAEPADVYTVTADDGAAFTLLLERLTYADGVRQCDWSLNDNTALVATAPTAGGYTSSITVLPRIPTTLLLLDMPILRDADDDAGYYMAAYGGDGWPGAGVYESPDGLAYTNIASITVGATAGATTTALGDWPGPWQIDNKNSVTVSLNGTLSSYSFDDTIAGLATPYLIGQEIVYAMTATLVSAGVYTLSGFIRALQGTEWATNTHAIAERFVVLQTAGMRRGEREAGELNIEYHFKGATIGSPLAAAEAQVFIDTGIGLKPFAPVDVKATRGTNGSITIAWSRRTRRSSTFLGTTEIQLGESSEAYVVQVMNAGFAAVLRSISATSPICVYTLAEQEADFGAAPGTLYLRVRQVSTIVGNGYANDATVPVGAATYFVPLTFNSYPDVRLSNGGHALITRNASTTMGLYRYAAGGSMELVGTTSADNAYRYFQGGHLDAVDAATGDWVMYLRSFGNQSSLRKLMRGNLAAGSALTVTPAFMPSNPPFALGFIAGTFIALCNDGGVYHSTDSGATWSSAGSLSGFTAPAAPASFASGKMMVVSSRLVLLYGGLLYYCTAGDGLVWSAATGDVASAPATYTTSFIVGAVDTLGAVGCATARGEVSGAFTSLVYTTTDGQAWTQAIAEAGVAGAYAYDVQLQNTGCLAYADAFYVTFAPRVSDVGRANIATLGTFAGKVVYYAPVASGANNRATASRVIQWQAASGDPIAADVDADTFTETVAWP